MIPRPQAANRIFNAFRVHPIVALLGPRQCGKTTLARMIAGSQPSVYFDLENPVDVRRLSVPIKVLEDLSGLVIIDEIQRQPSLFEILRVLVDRPKKESKFLILGSASPHLIKGVSESLAGRVGFVDLSGFDLREVGSENHKLLWVRGGFPRSFLAIDDYASMTWREDFIRTFLERDIPQFGITIPAETLRRFWTMIAHYHGQIWNAAEFARSLGTSENTARRYLDILAGAYMVRILPPWFENISKRQVKSPKVYIRDSGILHALLQLPTLLDIQGHPKLGTSWEGFALEQLLTMLECRDAYFWATHSGAELDLLVRIGGKRYGFEFKYSDAPGYTKSMSVAIQDLKLEYLWVIYPGKEEYPLSDKCAVLPENSVPSLVDKILKREVSVSPSRKAAHQRK
ncbi:MAG: ATP-binding protein [Thermodesulfobacteriota bacterium]